MRLSFPWMTDNFGSLPLPKMNGHDTKLLYLKVLIFGWLFPIVYATEWDYIVFTQSWPATLCIQHEHNRIDVTEKCIIPQDTLEWTIHGLWPNKFNGNNPSYCNKSVLFDDSKIQDIRLRLEKFWPNLLSDQTMDSLWRHEWMKHGTCALDLQLLNNERKYFKKGLDLYDMYNMTTLLPSLGILPKKNKEYSVVHILNLIGKALSKAPYVECVQEKVTEPHYLAEIRLCFNKSLQLIDCIPEYFQHDGHSLTNCPMDSTIIYPKIVNLKDLNLKMKRFANNVK